MESFKRFCGVFRLHLIGREVVLLGINTGSLRRSEDGRTETYYWGCAVLVRGRFWLQLLSVSLLPHELVARKSDRVLPKSVCDATGLCFTLYVRADGRAHVRTDVWPDVPADVRGPVLRVVVLPRILWRLWLRSRRLRL